MAQSIVKECRSHFNINNKDKWDFATNEIEISEHPQNEFYNLGKNFKLIGQHWKKIFIEEYDFKIHELSKIENYLSEISEDYIILRVPLEEKYSIGNGIEFNSFDEAIDFLNESNRSIKKILSLLSDSTTTVNEKYVLIRFQKMVEFIKIEYKEQIVRELFDIAMKSLFEYLDFLIKKHVLTDKHGRISKKNIPKYKLVYSSFFSKFIDLETEFYEFMDWDEDPLNEAVQVAYNELR